MQRALSTRGKIDRPHGGATSSIRESKVSVVLMPWCTQALHKLIITLLPLKPGEPASRRFDWGSRWHLPALLPAQEQPPPGAPSCKSSPLAIIIYAIAIKVSTMSSCPPCPTLPIQGRQAKTLCSGINGQSWRLEDACIEDLSKNCCVFTDPSLIIAFPCHWPTP